MRYGIWNNFRYDDDYDYDDDWQATMTHAHEEYVVWRVVESHRMSTHSPFIVTKLK
jgi:hypothetical protein